MSDRYTKVFSNKEDLYIEGAPVIIKAGALLKDNATNNIIAQFKFINVQSKAIKALTILVKQKDMMGNDISENVEYQYLDVNACRDEEFGQKVPVHMTEQTTRAVEVCVTQVVFSDNSIWDCDECVWDNLTKQTTFLERYTGKENMLAQYKRYLSATSDYLYNKQKDLWYCSSGHINKKSESSCHKCKEFLSVVESIDMDEIKIKAEDEERRQRIIKQQDELKQKVKTKKQIIIAAVLIAILVVFFGIIKPIVIPAMQNSKKYSKAVKCYESGDYDTAVDMFSELGQYKDSKEMETYLLALIALEEKNYDEAYSRFSEIKTFKNSSEYLSKFEEVCLVSEEITTGDYSGSKEYDYNIVDGRVETVDIKIYNNSYADLYVSNDTITVTYEYDSNGNIISETGVNLDDKTVADIEYSYDSNGNMTKKRMVDMKGMVSTSTFEYDNGKLIKEHSSNSDSNTSHILEYTYNDKGDVTSIKDNWSGGYYDGTVQERKYSYEYNEDGKMYSSIDSYYGLYDINSVYEYDKKGNVKQINISSEKQNNVTKFEYVYYYIYVE